MRTIAEIFSLLQEKAPLEAKMDFDTVGLLAGLPEWETDKVLLSLDITDDVVSEAGALGAGLVVSHHPMFFQLKSASSLSPEGGRTARLLSQKIAAICMHTNLDAADGGVNDALAAILGVEGALPFEAEHVARIGSLPQAMELQGFLGHVKEKLSAAGLRYVAGRGPVCRVAVGGGSCGSMLEEAVAAGCDTFVTSDVKYDTFLRAKELGISLIDAGHFPTENVVIPVLAGWLKEAFSELEVLISRHRQTEQYYV